MSKETDIPDLGDRIGIYAREKYPAHTAKILAKVTGAELRTARSWVEEGKMPGDKHLRALISEWGLEALVKLFEPELKKAKTKLVREISLLEIQLNSLQTRLRLEADLGASS